MFKRNISVAGFQWYIPKWCEKSSDLMWWGEEGIWKLTQRCNWMICFLWKAPFQLCSRESSGSLGSNFGPPQIWKWQTNVSEKISFPITSELLKYEFVLGHTDIILSNRGLSYHLFLNKPAWMLRSSSGSCSPSPSLSLPFNAELDKDRQQGSLSLCPLPWL